MLRRSPAFTTVVILTLALGIGANSAIFSVVNAVLLRPLPYTRPSRLLMFWETFPGMNGNYIPISEGTFSVYQKNNQVFSSMSGFRIRSVDNNRPVTLTGDFTAEAVNGISCTANLFETLGVKPAIGRSFTESDGEPGAPPVVILSHTFWQDRFGGSKKLVGSQIRLDGVAREVVGILPEGVFFPPPLSLMGTVRESFGDVFLPYPVDPGSVKVRTFRTVARLKDGLSFEQAAAGIKPLTDLIQKTHPEQNPKGLDVVLLPLHDQAVNQSRSVLVILLCAVGLILLIACVNVANLFLVRTMARRREVAIRTALGGSWIDIVRQLLMESVVLSLLGGVAGLVLAALCLKALVAISSTHVPRLGPVTIDGSVLLFTFGVSLLTGLIFGLAPTIQVTQPNLSEDLKEGERGNSGGGRRRESFRKALVMVEVAVAVVLLLLAGLLVRSLWLLQNAPLGFNSERVLTLSTLPPDTKYPKPLQYTSFFERFIEEVSHLPGVEQVGAVSQLPLSGGLFGGKFDIIGRPSAVEGEESGQSAAYRIITPGYLEALQIPLLEGRYINDGDREDSRPVALIDSGLAAQFWADGSWSSAQIRVIESGDPVSIVGVVDQIRNDDIRSDKQGIIYFPLRQLPNRSMNVVVRTSLQSEALAKSARECLRKIDPDVALNVQTLESYVYKAQSGVRAPAFLIATFAALALLLAIIGLYGVMSYLVDQGRREIGIRMALGARQSDILRRVGSQTGVIVLVGLAAGLVGGFLLSRLMENLLYGVTALDPLTYAGVGLVFLVVAALAGYIPARRASRVDPMEALRTE